jgi:hypothetical protein
VRSQRTTREFSLTPASSHSVPSKFALALPSSSHTHTPHHDSSFINTSTRFNKSEDTLSSTMSNEDQLRRLAEADLRNAARTGRRLDMELLEAIRKIEKLAFSGEAPAFTWRATLAEMQKFVKDAREVHAGITTIVPIYRKAQNKRDLFLLGCRLMSTRRNRSPEHARCRRRPGSPTETHSRRELGRSGGVLRALAGSPSRYPVNLRGPRKDSQ